MTRTLSFFARNRIALLACIALALLVVCSGEFTTGSADSVPEWLAAAGRADLGGFGSGSSAIVLGDWTDFTVDATGKYVLTERRALRVLNRRSVENYLEASGQENNDSKVTSIQTWAISPSGRITLGGKKDLTSIAGFSAFDEYTDVRVKLIRTPGVEDGSLVGYEVITQGRIPIEGEKFSMEHAIPTRLSELHVSVPSGSLRWFANHPDRVQVINQSPTGAEFRSENRPAIPDESDAPPFTSLAAVIFVNYDPKGPAAIKSWEEAGHEYHTLFDLGQKPESEIASQVEKLSAAEPNLLSKISALYTYVSRQIRYVAIEIGVGGYQPHAPTDVYKNNYGDCKDKATLLISMLGKIGLRAYPALVGTRGDVEADPSAPSLATFDHMIVALPVPETLRPSVEKFAAYDPKNHILWMDPTSDIDPIGQVLEMDQGVFALIAYPDHGDLQRIPETPAERSGTEYTVNVHLQRDGTGAAEVQSRYFGASNAYRHRFYRGKSQAEILQSFEARVAHYVNSASFRNASIAGSEDNSQQITEKFSFTGNFATASAGDTWFLQPLMLSGIAIPEVGTRPRQLPLDLGSPRHVKMEYRLEFPEGMKPERLPEKTSVKSEFGEITIEYSMVENALIATQVISYTESRILPENYPAFRDFVNSYARASRQRVRVVSSAP